MASCLPRTAARVISAPTFPGRTRQLRASSHGSIRTGSTYRSAGHTPLRGLPRCCVAQRAPFLDHRPQLRCPRACPLVGDAYALHRRPLEVRVTPAQSSTAHEPQVHAALAVPDERGEVAAL